MFRKTPLLVLVLVAAAVGYAAGAGSKLDEPMVVTPRLLVEVVCAAQSDTIVTYSYDGDRNMVVGKVVPRENINFTPAVGASQAQINAVLDRLHTAQCEKASRKGQGIAAFVSARVAPGARVEVR